jgi:hypothetical protein
MHKLYFTDGYLPTVSLLVGINGDPKNMTPSMHKLYFTDGYLPTVSLLVGINGDPKNMTPSMHKLYFTDGYLPSLREFAGTTGALEAANPKALQLSRNGCGMRTPWAPRSPCGQRFLVRCFAAPFDSEIFAFLLRRSLLFSEFSIFASVRFIATTLLRRCYDAATTRCFDTLHDTPTHALRFARFAPLLRFARSLARRPDSPHQPCCTFRPGTELAWIA